jgi:simple sugar transport system permease protein
MSRNSKVSTPMGIHASAAKASAWDKKSYEDKDPYVKVLGIVAVLLLVALSVAIPDRFLDRDNFASMAVQLSELGILSVAMTFSLLIGGIDLSVVSVANLSAILAGLVIKKLAPGECTDAQAYGALAAGVITGLAAGGVVGYINGLLISKIGVPSILATLGTMTVAAGLAFGVTNGSSVSGLPDQLVNLGNGSLLGIPVPFVVFLLVWLAADILVRRTSFGVSMILVGTSLKAARFSGIPTHRVITGTHMMTALFAAITGLVSLLRTNSAHADYGGTYVLLSILVSVLGGVSVVGGAGKLLGVLWALIILQSLSTGFNMLLLSVSGGNFFRDFVWGLLLLGVMTLTARLKSPKRIKHAKPVKNEQRREGT